jgi:hypothetical protein
MHVYAIKSFRRFQRKDKLADAVLWDAVVRADNGLIDADLGGGLIKQRVARKGQGKRGGYRTILAYLVGRTGGVFLYGFAKSQRDNIEADELEDWREIGSSLLRAGVEAVERAIADDELMEVYRGKEDDRT